jgi:glutamine amidotransferase
MCRLAAYLGRPARLSSLLYDPPHSLEKQAYAPREMVSGHVNVDGTGVAWWRDGEPDPLRYVSDRPPWSEPNLAALSPRLAGSPIVAVVRSQTPGMAAGIGAAHPFVEGTWAGTHNGYLERFADVRFDLIDRIDEQTRRGFATLTDSIVLFLLAVTALRGGATLAEAVVAAADSAADCCRAAGGAASLNLVLAAADEVVALRAAHGVEANSLYTLDGGSRWPDGRLVASEPLDDDGAWLPVPEDHVVRMTRDKLTIAPA